MIRPKSLFGRTPAKPEYELGAAQPAPNEETPDEEAVLADEDLEHSGMGSLAGISILAGNLMGVLLGRSSESRKAARLRRAFERRGGTFRKVGQLMAMQIDLLPWAYCVELSKIQDPMDPMEAIGLVGVVLYADARAVLGDEPSPRRQVLVGQQLGSVHNRAGRYAGCLEGCHRDNMML